LNANKLLEWRHAVGGNRVELKIGTTDQTLLCAKHTIAPRDVGTWLPCHIVSHVHEQ